MALVSQQMCPGIGDHLGKPRPPGRTSCLHKNRPRPSQQPSDLMSPAPYMQARYFYAPLRIELCLTPGHDERLTDQTWLTVSLLRD
ncbi:hypothetical protein NQZ68_013086 [Dissostichus eleginoides]|nr:hypothetical protein NQZ68_013086 [Dissostichus eleginoides]